jgi:hypothetical protein
MPCALEIINQCNITFLGIKCSAATCCLQLQPRQLPRLAIVSELWNHVSQTSMELDERKNRGTQIPLERYAYCGLKL